MERKAQGNRSLGRIGVEDAVADQRGEQGPGGSLFEAGDEVSFAARQFAAQENGLQEQGRFWFEGLLINVGFESGYERVQGKQPFHERDLVNTHFQEPDDKLAQGFQGEIASSVQIALPGGIGIIHHAWVVVATFQPMRQPTGHGPQSMCADACLQCHRMTHESADPTIAIGKRMDVVQAVMRRRHGDDATAFAQWLETVAFGEIFHESRYPQTGRWSMAAHRDFVFGSGAQSARLHAEGSPGSLEKEQRFGSVFVESAMQSAEEVQRGRFRGLAGGVLLVDVALNPDVRPRFQLQVTPIFGRGELVGERLFDLTRGSVVAFNPVGVVAVHDPQQVGQAGSGPGVQSHAEPFSRCCQGGDEVDEFGAGLLQQAGFDP